MGQDRKEREGVGKKEYMESLMTACIAGIFFAKGSILMGG